MTSGYNGVIQRKLALLTAQVGRLRAHLAGVDLDRFVGDWALRSMAERALEVAAEILIDVAERIIDVAGLGPVASSAEAIERLVEMRVLGSGEPFVTIVRFRNLLVHLYEDIDPRVVYQIATERLDDFLGFRDAVDRAAMGPGGGGDDDKES